MAIKKAKKREPRPLFYVVYDKRRFMLWGRYDTMASADLERERADVRAPAAAPHRVGKVMPCD